MHKRQAAFTLIELLLVVALIGILSGAVIKAVNTQGVRAKANDSQRVADLKKIQVALELRFADTRDYPTTGNLGELESGYIASLPEDPLEAQSYWYESDGATYTLVAQMEMANSANGICGSSGLGDCYGVTSPLSE
jgi:prepilin-type N-terminal cleavage/methylation domain-containing protein